MNWKTGHQCIHDLHPFVNLIQWATTKYKLLWQKFFLSRVHDIRFFLSLKTLSIPNVCRYSGRRIYNNSHLHTLLKINLYRYPYPKVHQPFTEKKGCRINAHLKNHHPLLVCHLLGKALSPRAIRSRYIYIRLRIEFMTGRLDKKAFIHLSCAGIRARSVYTRSTRRQKRQAWIDATKWKPFMHRWLPPEGVLSDGGAIFQASGDTHALVQWAERRERVGWETGKLFLLEC